MELRPAQGTSRLLGIYGLLVPAGIGVPDTVDKRRHNSGKA
jgi:hypothetical protein